MKKAVVYAVWALSAWLAMAQQQPWRISLPVKMVDLTNSLAQPGKVRVPLSPTNNSVEIVDWKSAAASSNHTAEFVVRLSVPARVGTVVAYEPGEISFLVSNQWQRLPAGIEEGRKLQIVPLPPGETIEALKFKVAAKKTSETEFQATLPFLTLLPVRLLNIAADAQVIAGSTNSKAKPAVLVDGMIGAKESFSTARRDKAATPGSPEWIQLTWKQSQGLRGLGLFRGTNDPGIGPHKVEVFVGTNAVPMTWSTNDWHTLPGRLTSPGAFAANQFFVGFTSVPTRALRITTTGEVHQVGLGEIAVLRELGEEPAPRKK